jgi:CheY-like chemotaxis protein
MQLSVSYILGEEINDNSGFICFAVTLVRSARQVIDALNAGPNIDLIPAELDLPLAKGMKMLKYINQDKELCRCIPVFSKFVSFLSLADAFPDNKCLSSIFMVN